MAETTTEQAPGSGVEQPTTQPAPAAPAPAEPPQEPQSQEPQAQTAQVDETAAWLQSKGITPDDPEYADKLLKMAFNSEKQMTKATQEASELRRSLSLTEDPGQYDPQQGDPMLQEFVQDYRRDKQINAFKESHPDWSQHEPVMVELLKEELPNGYTRSQYVNAGLLSLDDVYVMAKGTAPVDTEGIKTQAQQEVFQTLANTQRAGGGNAHASDPSPKAPDVDPITAAIRRNRGN